MTDTTKATASVDAQIESLTAQTEQAITAEASESSEASEAQVEQDQKKAPKSDEPDYGQAFKDLQEKKGFKSVDDLVRAYKAVESRSTKAEQAKVALEGQLETLQSLKDAGKLSNDQEAALATLEATIDKVLSKKLAPIQDVIGIQKVDRVIEDLRGKYPDFTGSVVDETLDYVLSNPKVSMEDAYKIVSYDQFRQKSVTTQAKQEKQKEKSRAYTESANGAKTDDVDYSKLSLEELEGILPVAGQFIDHRGKMRQG